MNGSGGSRQHRPVADAALTTQLPITGFVRKPARSMPAICCTQRKRSECVDSPTQSSAQAYSGFPVSCGTSHDPPAASDVTVPHHPVMDDTDPSFLSGSLRSPLTSAGDVYSKRRHKQQQHQHFVPLGVASMAKQRLMPFKARKLHNAAASEEPSTVSTLQAKLCRGLKRAHGGNNEYDEPSCGSFGGERGHGHLLDLSHQSVPLSASTFHSGCHDSASVGLSADDEFMDDADSRRPPPPHITTFKKARAVADSGASEPRPPVAGVQPAGSTHCQQYQLLAISAVGEDDDDVQSCAAAAVSSRQAAVWRAPAADVLCFAPSVAASGTDNLTALAAVAAASAVADAVAHKRQRRGGDAEAADVAAAHGAVAADVGSVPEHLGSQVAIDFQELSLQSQAAVDMLTDEEPDPAADAPQAATAAGAAIAAAAATAAVDVPMECEEQCLTTLASLAATSAADFGSPLAHSLQHWRSAQLLAAATTRPCTASELQQATTTSPVCTTAFRFDHQPMATALRRTASLAAAAGTALLQGLQRPGFGSQPFDATAINPPTMHTAQQTPSPSPLLTGHFKILGEALPACASRLRRSASVPLMSNLCPASASCAAATAVVALPMLPSASTQQQLRQAATAPLAEAGAAVPTDVAPLHYEVDQHVAMNASPQELLASEMHVASLRQLQQLMESFRPAPPPEDCDAEE